MPTSVEREARAPELTADYGTTGRGGEQSLRTLRSAKGLILAAGLIRVLRVIRGKEIWPRSGLAPELTAEHADDVEGFEQSLRTVRSAERVDPSCWLGLSTPRDPW